MKTTGEKILTPSRGTQRSSPVFPAPLRLLPRRLVAPKRLKTEVSAGGRRLCVKLKIPTGHKPSREPFSRPPNRRRARRPDVFQIERTAASLWLAHWPRIPCREKADVRAALPAHS